MTRVVLAGVLMLLVVLSGCSSLGGGGPTPVRGTDADSPEPATELPSQGTAALTTVRFARVTRDGALVAEGELVHVYDVGDNVFRENMECDTVVGLFDPDEFDPRPEEDRSLSFVCADGATIDTSNQSVSTSFAQFREAHGLNYPRLPLRGTWYTMQGHEEIVGGYETTHRREAGAGTFAWDFTRLAPDAKGGYVIEEYGSHEELRKPSEFTCDYFEEWDDERCVCQDDPDVNTGGASNVDYYAFGEPIYAPVTGTVSFVEDSHEDICPFEAFGDANEVLVHLSGGYYLWFHHLKQGSVTTEEGEVIQAGEKLAEVGNSGFTFTAHLHTSLIWTGRISDGDIEAPFSPGWSIPSVFEEVYVETGPADDSEARRELDYDPSTWDFVSNDPFTQPEEPGGEIDADDGATVLHRVLDLSVNDTQHVTLNDGTNVEVRLIELDERWDVFHRALREARVHVVVNGEESWLGCGNYNLPTRVGGVRVDCAVTSGYYENTVADWWGLEGDARIRVWPADGPLIPPGTLVYPLEQKLFSSDTTFSNEPVWIDGPETIEEDFPIYYHAALDFDGAEGAEPVLAAADGVIVVAPDGCIGKYLDPEELEAEGQTQEDCGAGPPDYVLLMDERGWWHTYAHLAEVDVSAGENVSAGDVIGTMGKEGESGGTAHLHYNLGRTFDNGAKGVVDAFDFVFADYVRRYDPELMAIARPHAVTDVGVPVRLDGSSSWSASGTSAIVSYEWTLPDGTVHDGARVNVTFDTPGAYAPVLTVRDEAGNVDHDPMVVIVYDSSRPALDPPTIHLAYHPTRDIEVGQPVTFWVRSFGGVPEAGELVDFDDGSPPVRVYSDATNEGPHNPDGYATVTHVFDEPGRYLVTATRESHDGVVTMAKVEVVVSG